MSSFEGRSELGRAAAQAIQRAAPGIVALCEQIFEDPEPAFGETRAVSRLTGFLASAGFEIEPGLAGLPTAFRASYRRFDTEAMRKGLRHGHVAILAEYDADDERGHTSGRHLVAGAALASAVGLAATLHGIYGEVTVVGCPAASTAEGKRLLAAAGVFDPVDAALGARPASSGLGFQPTIRRTGETFATLQMRVQFDGPAGESDARQRLATAVEAVAQTHPETSYVEAVFTEGGLELNLRAETNPDLDRLTASVRERAKLAASETGSSAEIEIVGGSPALNINRVLARRIKTFADTIGLNQDRIVKTQPSGSTDWGHVSLVTSVVEARYPISEDTVESGTEAFTRASVSRYGFDQMLTASTAVASTGLDLLGDMEFRGFTEGELIRTLEAQGVKRTPRRWLGVHPVKPRESANGQPPASSGQPAGSGQS